MTELVIFAVILAVGWVGYISLNVERMLKEVRAIRGALEDAERQRRGW